MSINPPDYLTYKKSKQKIDKAEKKNSKVRAVVWICLLTFSFCFAVFTNFAARYSTKMDIEYDKSATLNDGQSYIGNAFGKDSLASADAEDAVRSIDNRLRLIQLEETAPSEARALKKDKNVVIDREHYEKITAGESIFAPEKTAEYREKRTDKTDNIIPVANKVTPALPGSQPDISAQTFSKVLVGRYKTFDDAKTAQLSIRNSGQVGTPFIRKIGDIYTLQIGSYANPDVAKNIAQNYSEQNYDVWILQN